MLLVYLLEAKTKGCLLNSFVGNIKVLANIALGIFRESLELTDLLSEMEVFTEEFLN